MKLFRTIWYSVLAVLTALLVTLTCIQVNVPTQGSVTDAQSKAVLAHAEALGAQVGSIYDEAGHAERVAYLKDTLTAAGYTDVTDTVTVTDGKYDATATGSSFAVVEMTVTGADRYAWETERTGKSGDEQYHALTLTNVIVFRSGKTASVNLLAAGYDSLSTTAGTSDVLAASALLGYAAEHKSQSLEEGSLIVFADGAQYDDLGLWAVMNKFVGFNNAVSSVKGAVVLESNHGAGALYLSETTANASALAAKIGVSSVGSSAVGAFAPSDNTLAMFGAVPAIKVENRGNAESLGTQLDGEADLRTAKALYSVVDKACVRMDGVSTFAKGASVVSLGSILNYGSPVAYVLAGVTLLVAIAAFIVGSIKRTLSIGSVLKGLAVTVAVAVVGLVFGLALYYVLGLLFAGFGSVDIHALATLTFSSTAAFLLFAFTVGAFALAAYVFFKRIFLAKAGEVVRGNALLWIVAAVVSGFVAPAVSPLFAVVGLLEAVMMLMQAIFKDYFRTKHGMDMDRLFLWVVPAILALPVVLGTALMLGELLGACVYPFLALLPLGLLGFIAPYFDYLRPVFDKLVKKLPARKERVVQTVTEMVEDPARPGRKVEKTYRKTSVREVENSYKNRHGIVALCLVGVIATMCLCAGNAPFAANIAGASNEFYDDAVVYTYDNGNTYWKVADLDAYRYVSEAIGGWSWDSDLGAYTHNGDEDATHVNNLLPLVTNTETDGKEKTFTVSAIGGMRYSLTFDSVETIDHVIVRSGLVNGVLSEDEEYKPVNGVLVIEGLLADTTVTVVGVSGAYTGTVTFDGAQTAWEHDEVLEDNTELRNFESVWPEVRSYFDRNGLIELLRGTVEILNYKLSI